MVLGKEASQVHLTKANRAVYVVTLTDARDNLQVSLFSYDRESLCSPGDVEAQVLNVAHNVSDVKRAKVTGNVRTNMAVLVRFIERRRLIALKNLRTKVGHVNTACVKVLRINSILEHDVRVTRLELYFCNSLQQLTSVYLGLGDTRILYKFVVVLGNGQIRHSHTVLTFYVVRREQV